MTRTACALVLLALLVPAAGCARNHLTTRERYERGLVVCLGGAGGIRLDADNFRAGLDEGGVDRAIEVFDWSSHLLAVDQAATGRNRRKAADLAERIVEYQAAHPGRPVHLVGLSTGTAIAVWAIEALPPDREVTGAVLAASSLGSHYDLGPALAKVEDRIDTFHSPMDPVLWVGVPVFGSADRRGRIPAGGVGFKVPAKADPATRDLYRRKLVQHAWRPGDAALGNFGDHLGANRRAFVRERIAPLVMEGAGPEALMAGSGPGPEAPAAHAAGGPAGKGPPS